MANVEKMFARDFTLWETGSTAALSYPDRWTPSVHHKKRWPSTATSHESRPESPSFCIFGLPHWASPRTAVGQITRNTELGKPLGYYPNTSTRCYTTTRRSNDPARSQPRRQRRHKLHHGHKDEQTSRFQPSSAHTADPETHKLQVWRTGTWTRTSSTSKARTARLCDWTLRPLQNSKRSSSTPLTRSERILVY